MTRKMHLTLDVTEEERAALVDAIKLYCAICRHSPDAPERRHVDAEQFAANFEKAWLDGRWLYESEERKCIACGEPSTIHLQVPLCTKCVTPPHMSQR